MAQHLQKVSLSLLQSHMRCSRWQCDLWDTPSDAGSEVHRWVIGPFTVREVPGRCPGRDSAIPSRQMGLLD